MKAKKASWLQGYAHITSNSNLEKTASEHMKETQAVFMDLNMDLNSRNKAIVVLCVEHTGFSKREQKC